MKMGSYKTKEDYIAADIKDGSLDTYLYISDVDSSFPEYFEFFNDALFSDDIDNHVEIHFDIEDVLNNMIEGEQFHGELSGFICIESKDMFSALRSKLSNMIDKIDGLEFIEYPV